MVKSSRSTTRLLLKSQLARLPSPNSDDDDDDDNESKNPNAEDEEDEKNAELHFIVLSL
jgi:hypothetical protein